LYLITRLGVAKEVRADTLLGRIVSLELRAPVGGTTDTEGSSLPGHVITITRRGDGVKTDRVGLSVLFTDTWGYDTPRLTLPVGEVTVVVDNDVASLTRGLGSDNTLGGDDLASEGRLVLVHIDRDSGLIIVRFGLKKVLLSIQRSAVGKRK
jgi:hypothetical protein